MRGAPSLAPRDGRATRTHPPQSRIVRNAGIAGDEEWKMRRTIGLAVALLAVPVMGASMATTTFAATASHAISQGSGSSSTPWVIVAQNAGCENVLIKGNGKFVATTDGTHNHGKWSTPTDRTVTLQWTGGPATGFVFKGTLNTSTDVYNGHLAVPGEPKQKAILELGSISGC
jgi:hypothetical protein